MDEAPVPAPQQPDGLTRRVNATAREMSIDMGRFAHRHPGFASVGAGIVVLDFAGSMPGLRGVDLLAGIVGGVATHRYITRHSRAAEEARNADQARIAQAAAEMQRSQAARRRGDEQGLA